MAHGFNTLFFDLCRSAPFVLSLEEDWVVRDDRNESLGEDMEWGGGGEDTDKEVDRDQGEAGGKAGVLGGEAVGSSGSSSIGSRSSGSRSSARSSGRSRGGARLSAAALSPLDTAVRVLRRDHALVGVLLNLSVYIQSIFSVKVSRSH